MAGGVAILILGAMLAIVLGCLPFFTVMTFVKPSMHWFSRVFLGAVISLMCFIGIAWTSAEQHEGWIFGTYTLVMIGLNGVALAVLSFRWLIARV